jgi:hypothetical protein
MAVGRHLVREKLPTPSIVFQKNGWSIGCMIGLLLVPRPAIYRPVWASIRWVAALQLLAV